MKRRRFITKRTCLMVVVLLVGGAIVNVAVAWGCGWLSDVNNVVLHHDVVFLHSEFPPAEDGSIRRELSTVARAGFEDREVTLCSGPGIRAFQLRLPHRHATQKWRRAWDRNSIWWLDGIVWRARFLSDNEGQMFVAQGWPVLALRCEQLDPPGWRHGMPVSGTIVPARAHLDRVFACAPIWPGFAINTVFYAAVLWMLSAVPLAFRKMRGGRRIKRGLCPKCAYDLRGRPPAPDSTVCPECGMSVEPTP